MYGTFDRIFDGENLDSSENNEKVKIIIFGKVFYCNEKNTKKDIITGDDGMYFGKYYMNFQLAERTFSESQPDAFLLFFSAKLK